jgi:hypothetical protein
MPLVLVLVLLDVTLVIHAAKTGRASPWAYIILMVPGIGAIAYVVAVLVPDWFGSVQGLETQRAIANKLNPEKRYRALCDAVEIADTIANRVALAEECLELEKYEEAKRHFAVVLSRPMGDEPVYMLGKARAEFGLGRPDETIATLEALRERWPDYQSGEGHLLYARSLEAVGRLQGALAEYQALSAYYVGAEARVRYGVLLVRMGREMEAKAWLSDVLKQLRRSPAHVRKAQAEWIVLAERALRA